MARKLPAIMDVPFEKFVMVVIICNRGDRWVERRVK